MKNFKKVTAAALAISFSFLGASVTSESNLSYASQSQSAPKIDLGVSQANYPYQESVVTLKQDDATRQQFMDHIVELRTKAWNDNLIVPWYGEGENTKSVRDIYIQWSDGDPEWYKNAFNYNYGLEKLALQRAYELTLTGDSQNRPDGSHYNTMYHEDYSLGNADTFWVFDEKNEVDVDTFFEMFASDKKYNEFKNSKGSMKNAILETLVMYQPAQLSIGYGQVTNKETGRSFAVVAFDLDPYVWADEENYVGDYTMSFGNPNFKQFSKERLDKLEKSVKNAKETIEGAKILMQKMPKFAKEHGNELNKLIEKQNKIIDKAETILRANGR
ncbi:hypothetical protein [Anaerococcus sp.]|uniref:hypothetical protein n=1 Tax=Anaerococcus sp. TaxID=1872515 RepID=UPI002904737C|nr:hypothetical protein [Anaerococcus sp.]MDU2599005.1 hypothetical protein [Anaerococcus sp.]